MGYLESLLGADEQVVFVARHHWTALARRALGYLLLVLLGLVLAVAGNLFAGPLLRQLGLQLDQMQEVVARAVLVLVLLVYPVVSLVVRYIWWRGDQFIVTNFRVIHLRGVFAKRVIDSSLEKVNDVVLYQSFLGRLMDFGDIEILTSSDIGVNKVTRIARPLAFKKAMLDAKQELEGGSRRPSIPQLISELAELRDRGAITEEEYQTQKANLLRRM